MNRDKYLNFWVSDNLKQLPSQIFGDNNTSVEILVRNFESRTLELAQFPGETGQPSPFLPNYSLTDGLWVTANAFGNTGNVISPYNLGRTASYEVGIG